MTCPSPHYITTSSKLFQIPQFLIVYYSFSIFFSFCQLHDIFFISTVSYCVCDGFSQCLNLPQFLQYCVSCMAVYFTFYHRMSTTSHCFSCFITMTQFLTIYLILSKLYGSLIHFLPQFSQCPVTK